MTTKYVPLPLVISMFDEKKGLGEGWIAAEGLGSNEEKLDTYTLGFVEEVTNDKNYSSTLKIRH